MDLTVRGLVTLDASGVEAGAQKASGAINQIGKAEKDAAAEARGLQTGTAQARTEIDRVRASSSAAATATNTLAKAHAGMSTQGMAAFHAMRSMAEGLAMGIPPSQLLAMQLNHLSFAASGPQGLRGAFSEAASAATSLLVPALTSAWTVAGVAAAGIAVLTMQVLEYERSVQGLRNTINAQGNPFHISAEGAEVAAVRIAKAANTTMAEGRNFEKAFNAAGLDPRLWEQAGAAVRKFSDGGLGSLDEALKTVAGAAAAPAQGIDHLNQVMHLADGVQTEHVKSLAAGVDQYRAQAAVLDLLSQRLNDGTIRLTKFDEVGRNVGNWVKDKFRGDDIAKQLVGYLPDDTWMKAGPDGITNQQSDNLQRLADQTDSYGATVRRLNAEIANTKALIAGGTLSDTDLSNAHRILAADTLQLQQAEKARADQLRALNPEEQAHYERVKSLIGSSQEAIAQARAQADSSKEIAEASTGSALAIQDTNDALERQQRLLPYVTALQYASGDQQKKLLAIIAQLRAAMFDDQAYRHYADAIRDVRQGLQSVSEWAPDKTLRDSLDRNVKDLEGWRDAARDALRASEGAHAEYFDYLDEVFNDKMAQLYEDDLRRRKDWAAGVERANLDITRSHQDMASKSEQFVRGFDRSAEDDFVSLVKTGKLQTSELVDFVIDQFARMAYQKYLASSFNALGNSLLDTVGSALGLTGGGGLTVPTGGLGDTGFPNIGTPQFGGGANGNWSFSLAGARAGGGPVEKGKTYLVGEDGAELFTAPSDGTISTHRDTISALSSAPRTFVVPAASAAAAPVVHFKVINNHPTAQVKEGQSKRNSDGSYSLEAVVSQIEDQMADNIHRGTSPVAHMLEQTHGLERRPAG